MVYTEFNLIEYKLTTSNEDDKYTSIQDNEKNKKINLKNIESLCVS